MVSRTVSQSHGGERVDDSRPPLLGRNVRVHKRELDVLVRGRAREEVVRLEDEADALTPHAGATFILVRTLAACETMIERIEPPEPGTFPFSGAVVAGPFVFVSGQVGTDPKTGTTPSLGAPASMAS